MYENFYGLRAEPFRLSPDHNFCYEHKAYAKARAYMSYAFMRAEGFVMVTGRPGTGKTTLVGELIDNLAQDDVSTANLVCTQLGADDLLKTVAYHFGIEAERADKAELIQKLSALFHRWHREGRRALLIVDEAQDLTISAMEELRLLTNIQLQGQPLLQIFLLGQPELRELILSPELEQVHQRVVAACHLEGLDAEEVQDYVLHRLQSVGWSGDPAISRAVFPLLHRFSEGIPRRINLICARLFLHGSVEQRHQIGVEDLGVVIAELQSENLAAGTRITEGEFAVTSPEDWVTKPDSSVDEAPAVEVESPVGAPPEAATGVVEPLRSEPHLRAVDDQSPPAYAEPTSGTVGGAQNKEGSDTAAPPWNSATDTGSQEDTTAPRDDVTRILPPTRGVERELVRPRPVPVQPVSPEPSTAYLPTHEPSAGPIAESGPLPEELQSAPEYVPEPVVEVESPAPVTAAAIARRDTGAAPVAEPGQRATAAPARGARPSTARKRRRTWPFVVLGLFILAALVGTIFALPQLEQQLRWLSGGNNASVSNFGNEASDSSAAEFEPEPVGDVLTQSATQYGTGSDSNGLDAAVGAASTNDEMVDDEWLAQVDALEEYDDGAGGVTTAAVDLYDQLPDTQSGAIAAELTDSAEAEEWNESADLWSDEQTALQAGSTTVGSGAEQPMQVVSVTDDVAAAPGVKVSEAVGAELAPTPEATQEEARPVPASTVPLMLLVSFAFDSVELSARAEDVLIEAARHMTRHPGATAHITGYADPSGDVLYNQNLSQERAFAVERYLVASGVADDRLTVEGLGVSSPGLTDEVAASSSDGERNRIVQIQILPEDI